MTMLAAAPPAPATDGTQGHGPAPHYPVAAIDNTLRTLQLLDRLGPVRVVDVATHLVVARSTAHRVLTMLTYYGFAEQDDDRRYHLTDHLEEPARGTTRDLVARAEPALVEVAETTGFTAHVVVLEGNGARFLHGVESRQASRLDIRDGLLYPAHLTAGGRALLAQLGQTQLQALFPSRITGTGAAALDHRSIWRVLDAVGRHGFAVNEGENEAGVNAVGVPVPEDSGGVRAALVAAGRADRMPRAAFAHVAGVLTRCAERVGRAS